MNIVVEEEKKTVNEETVAETVETKNYKELLGSGVRPWYLKTEDLYEVMKHAAADVRIRDNAVAERAIEVIDGFASAISKNVLRISEEEGVSMVKKVDELTTTLLSSVDNCIDTNRYKLALSLEKLESVVVEKTEWVCDHVKENTLEARKSVHSVADKIKSTAHFVQDEVSNVVLSQYDKTKYHVTTAYISAEVYTKEWLNRFSTEFPDLVAIVKEIIIPENSPVFNTDNRTKLLSSWKSAMYSTSLDYVNKAATVSQEYADKVVKTAQPLVIKAVDAAAPYISKAVVVSEPYVSKAVDAAQPYVCKAANVAQPFVVKSADVAQPYIEKVVEASTPYVSKAVTTAQPFVSKAAVAIEPIMVSPNVSVATAKIVDTTVNAVTAVKAYVYPETISAIDAIAGASVEDMHAPSSSSLETVKVDQGVGSDEEIIPLKEIAEPRDCPTPELVKPEEVVQEVGSDEEIIPLKEITEPRDCPTPELVKPEKVAEAPPQPNVDAPVGDNIHHSVQSKKKKNNKDKHKHPNVELLA